MTGWNTDSVIDLLLECAEIARRIKSDPEIEIKDDRTPVSNADKGIEELLTRRLGAENVLGEESFQKRDHNQLIDQLLHGRIWIVDPIDGTANFINRRPLWGITIGYAENGMITRGGVFLPKQVGKMEENAKVAVRNIRRELNDDIKKLELPEDNEKESLDDVQKLTDKKIADIEVLTKKKSEDLMSF